MRVEMKGGPLDGEFYDLNDGAWVFARPVDGSVLDADGRAKEYHVYEGNQDGLSWQFNYQGVKPAAEVFRGDNNG